MNSQEEQLIGFAKEFDERVIQVNRVSKKTKGGNKIGFSVLTVVGDKKGKVGLGLSKALDVRSAVAKSLAQAKRKMVDVPIMGTTIPYSVFQKFSAAKIILKPAPPGSGLIAGGPMRVVLATAGIKDAVGKILGTKNKASNVYPTFEALKQVAKIGKRKQK